MTQSHGSCEWIAGSSKRGRFVTLNNALVFCYRKKSVIFVLCFNFAELGGAATATGTTARFGRFGFRAIPGIEPAVSLEAESAGRDKLFNCSATLRALAGGGVGKFLAQFKLVIAACTAIFVHRHSGFYSLDMFVLQILISL